MPREPRQRPVRPAGALSGLRVIDLGEMVSAPFAARLLGDAGAEVIKVEPLGGDPSRENGPFPKGVIDEETSALYLYLNAGKLSVTIDIRDARGKTLLHELISQADVLMMNWPPKMLDRFGLRYSRLKSKHPRLIVTAITPFGLSGRYRDYKGDDLIAVSAGGLAFATPGIPDVITDPSAEPPLRAESPVSDYLAGISGAMATMAAVLSRRLTGRGSEVDVSQQESVAMNMAWDIAHASYLTPKGRQPEIAGSQPNHIFPCKDGHVVIVAFLQNHWESLLEIMGDPEWAKSPVFANGFERARNWDALEPFITEWTLRHTAREIGELALGEGIPCFPACEISQVVNSEQAKARGYFQSHRLGDEATVQLPGHPVRMSKTPWLLGGSAPKLGEHTAQILGGRLGHTAKQMRALKAAGVISNG